jgi:hypothetical protein
MNTPVYTPTWNITTILGAVNLALVLVGGGAAYANLRNETLTLREAYGRLEAADAQIRAEAVASEARLRTVEQGASRMETKLEAIAQGIERLNVQMDRLINTRP